MSETEKNVDFIREIVEADLAADKHGGRVVTRFPPEPNGYLHIGHAKSICLNFGIAKDYGGKCHLRMDDTNPTKEDEEYVRAIQGDVRWLGFDWGENFHHASDYFERLYGFAVELIESGKAYVCSLKDEQIREYRGTVTEPGRPSPYRERSVKENLDLFARMRAGEFPDGAHVLRAKIDMASPNMKMRDPLLYRIRHAHHYRTGDDWCIYPLYDFTHCLSDAIEGITHSICTLEFENNRELYDWVLDNVSAPARPHQYEFARLALTYTVMSKRKLLELVQSGRVSGWDDPRMPTLAGFRRRGVTPDSIRAFCDRIGVAKNNSTVDVALLEHTIREDLNERSPRLLCVLEPLEVVIENYDEHETETLDAPLWPHDIPKQGSRELPFSRRLYIERDDFAETPPKGWHRLSPGAEVRLRHAYVIRCERVEKDASGRVERLVCSYDPATRGGAAGAKKVKGTIHWVSAPHAADVEVRLYDRLFSSEQPGAESGDALSDLNPSSLVVRRGKAEPAVAALGSEQRIQLERLGFFFTDPIDSRPGAPALNRIVPLKDTWQKLAARGAATAPKAEKPKPDVAPPRATEELSPAARDLLDKHGLSQEDARQLGEDAALCAIFEAALGFHDNARAIASWLVNELPSEYRGEGVARLPFGAREIAALVRLVDTSVISGKIAKDVLAEMLQSGKSPDAIVKEKGLTQIADAGSLGPIVDQVLADNADVAERYRAGNKNLLGAFVGMVMKATSGKANPKLVNELLRQKLG